MRELAILTCYFLYVLEISARFSLPDSDDLCLKVNSTKTRECTSPKAGVLLCYNHIPEDPVGYSAVVVVACTVIDAIKENNFFNANWSSVQSFTYTKTELERFVLNIGPFAFRQMKNLHSLYIDNLRGRVNFNNESFCGLEQLKTFDLTGSLDLKAADLLTIFSLNCSLPKIESLSFANTVTRQITLNETLVKLILHRPIKYFDLQGFHDLYVDFRAFSENADSLEEIYLQNTKISGNGRLENSEKPYFPELRILNLSGIGFYSASFFCNSKSFKLKDNVATQILPRLQLLVWDSACLQTAKRQLKRLYFDNVTCFYNSDLKHISLRDDGFEILNGSFDWPGNRLESADLSNNNISYLGPNIVSAFKKLKVLVLGGNELNRMSESHTNDFEILFQSLSLLESLDLSRNKIAAIPKNTFISNSQLRILNLSFNELTIINFTLNNMMQLEILDLHGNAIQFHDYTTQFILTDFIRLYNTTKRQTIRASAKLTCSKCEDLDSIKWLVTHKYIFNEFDNMSCLLESGNTSALTTDVLENIDTICNRQTRVIQIGVNVIAAIPILLLVVRKIKSKLRTRRSTAFKEHNLTHWRNWSDGEKIYEYAVFLSFASKDKALARLIWHFLNTRIKEHIGTERDVVFFSDLHMLSGSISGGIKDAVDRSTGIMFVISDAEAFKNSEWCEIEFLTAMENKRPLFIITTDDLNLDLLPLYFKATFQNTARIVLKRLSSRTLDIGSMEHSESEDVPDENAVEEFNGDDNDDVHDDDDTCFRVNDTINELQTIYELQTTWERVVEAILQMH